MSINLDDIESRIATGIYGDDRLSKEERNDSFSALAEIRTEVERLRGEAAQEREAERADVVAWLRNVGRRTAHGFANVCGILADAIERGEHRREGGE